MFLINVNYEDGKCCEVLLEDDTGYPMKFDVSGVNSMVIYDEDCNELFTSEKGISDRSYEERKTEAKNSSV